LNLVDPDNRRPVDYARRIAFLNDIKAREADPIALISDLWATRQDGRIKMFLMHRILQARQAHKDLFEKGTYVPLQVKGELENNLIAFGRQYQGQYAVALAVRFPTQFLEEKDLNIDPQIWGDTAIELPSQWPLQWQNAIDGQMVQTGPSLMPGVLFKNFPGVLLLHRQSA
jgi:(1->4)-alpha-D-glucan 1-alpha-D-glucosylmutase